MATPKQVPIRSFFIGIVTVVLLTLVITVYSGNRTQRFASFRGIDESRKLLRELPLTIGDWETEQEATLSTSDVHQLEIEDGYISRRYKNTKTRSEVNFVMMIGPAGRIVVHTPEFCFGGRNFEKENDGATLVSLPIVAPAEKGPTEEAFWKVSFINRALRGDKISFYYAVSSGGPWSAVDNPRYEFSRFLYVYKIQVEAEIGHGGADPAYAFLTDALPTIRRHMQPCQ